MQLAYQRGIFNGNILVSVKNKVIYKKSFGYADGSRKSPLNIDHKFDIGSISKEFNGTAIMLLAEQGKLSLNDSLAKYFPEFPNWAKQVKIKHLINYTSGIPALGAGNDSTDHLIYQNLTRLPALAAEPGTVYIYNHVNVTLQHLIIEKVSNLSYAEFIRKNLLAPAGMNHSSVDLPVTSPGMARAFDEAGNNSTYALGTKGWVRLPVGDLYRWVKAINENKIISAGSLKLLAQNFPGGESSLGTTGYKGDQLTWHQHQGSNFNYEAAFYADIPGQIVIVMMTNNQQMKVWPLKTAILSVLHDQPVSVPKKSLYLSIRDRILANTEEGLNYYRQLKQTAQDQYDFSFEIGDLISTGKYLQRRNKNRDAVKVFTIAVQLKAEARDVAYGYELIGDCYQSMSLQEDALVNYQKAIALDPANKNAEGRIKTLTNSAKLK